MAKRARFALTVVGILGAATSCTAFGESFHEALSKQPASSWLKLNLNRFDDAWLRRERQPITGSNVVGEPAAIIGAWSSMAWDSNRGELVVWGGGHANYPGNEVYRWRSSTRKWERASLPSAMLEPSLAYHVAVDGIDSAPAAAHTYDMSEFLPIADRWISFGGAAYNTGRFWEDETLTRKIGPYLWDPKRGHPDRVGGSAGSQERSDKYPNTAAGNMWDHRDNLESASLNLPNYPGRSFQGFIDGTTAYARERNARGLFDVLYVNDFFDLWKYSLIDPDQPDLDSFQLVGVGGKPVNGQGAGAFDPDRKLFVRTYGNTGDIMFWNLDQAGPTNAATDVNFVDVDGDFAIGDLKWMGIDYDSVRRRFVLWDGANSLWTLTPPRGDPATDNWTIASLTVSANPNVPAMPKEANTGVLGKFKYVREYDIFLGLWEKRSGNLWAYKPADWRPTVDTSADREAPGVAITTPSEDVAVDGNVVVEVAAQDNDALAEVRLYASGELVDSTSSAPYRFSVDSTRFADGYLALRAEATDRAGNAARSDGIRVAVANGAPGEIIVDNLSSNTTHTGSLWLSLARDPFAGSAAIGQFAFTFTWTPEIPAPGQYDVYAWWTSSLDSRAADATRAPYDVTHSAGVTTVEVDQTVPGSGGRWARLGRFNFSAGRSGKVTLSTRNGPVTVDAVRFVPASGLPSPPTPPNSPPIAAASASPMSGPRPTSVNFDASASTDPDGDDLTYAWVFGDGATGSGVAPSHTYTTAGTYTATVTVTDSGGGSDSASLRIVVRASASEPNPGGGIESDEMCDSYVILIPGRGAVTICL